MGVRWNIKGLGEDALSPWKNWLRGPDLNWRPSGYEPERSIRVSLILLRLPPQVALKSLYQRRFFAQILPKF